MKFQKEHSFFIILISLCISTFTYAQTKKDSLIIESLWNNIVNNDTLERYELALEDLPKLKQLAIANNQKEDAIYADMHAIWYLFKLKKWGKGKNFLDQLYQEIKEEKNISGSFVDMIYSDLNFLYGYYNYEHKFNYAASIKHYKECIDFGGGYFPIDGLYNNLGLIYQKLGDYQMAMDNYLPFINTSGHWEAAVTCNNIALSALATKDYPKTYRYLKEGESYIKQMELTEGVKNIYANISNNLAKYYLETKGLQNAHTYLDKGLALATEQDQELINYQHRASAYLQAKNYTQTKIYLDNALKGYIQDKITPNRVGEIYHLYGKYYHNLNQPQKALQQYQKALTIFGDNFKNTTNVKANPIKAIFGHEVDLLNTLMDKAIVLQEIEDLETALATYQVVDQILDDIRSQNLSTNSSKYFWVGEAKQLYEKSIAIAIQLGEEELAYQFCQKSHALILWEKVQNIRAANLGNVPEEVVEQEKELKINIAAESIKAADQKDNYDHQILFDYKEQLKDLHKEMEQKYPLYYQIKYELPVTDLKTIQQTLTKTTALVEYFVGESHIYTFVITSTNFKVYTQKKPNDFLKNIELVRETTSKYNNTQLNFDNYTKSAFALYETLLKKVVRDFPKEQIMIIPDEELGYLNFGTFLSNLPESNDLRYDQLAYLINQYDFGYNYSSALFIQLNNHRKKRINQLSFMGFAPIYPGSPKTTRQGEELDSLLYNLSEVLYIKEVIGGKIYTGKAATVENLKNNKQGYKIAHFAMHATCDDLQPENSKVHFADTSLSSHEIYNLDLNCELVVLSACKTGSGKLQKGEGILGLSRAFMSSGTPSVITSLWNVNDKKTATLMRLIYENLSKGQEKHIAIGNAQRTYLTQEYAANTHPFYWGAFVPIGNMQPVFEESHSGWHWWGLVGVGGLLLLFLIRRNR